MGRMRVHNSTRRPGDGNRNRLALKSLLEGDQGICQALDKSKGKTGWRQSIPRPYGSMVLASFPATTQCRVRPRGSGRLRETAPHSPVTRYDEDPSSPMTARTTRHRKVLEWSRRLLISHSISRINAMRRGKRGFFVISGGQSLDFHRDGGWYG